MDGTLYLRPYDADAHEAVGIKSTGLSVGSFRSGLMEVAKRRGALILLDARHAGVT